MRVPHFSRLLREVGLFYSRLPTLCKNRAEMGHPQSPAQREGRLDGATFQDIVKAADSEPSISIGLEQQAMLAGFISVAVIP